MNKGKYNIVSGLGRSGTSLMMQVLRQSGVPITGFRYYFHVPELTFDGKMIDAGICFPNDRLKKINKDGIWEIYNLAVHTGITEHYRDVGFEGDAIKVFAAALVKSEPDLINKVIFILREPTAMLASMIQAGEFTEHQAEGASRIMADEIKIALDFLEKNDKDFMIVRYEKLLEDPLGNVTEVCNFLGRGEPEYGAKVIDKSLNHNVSGRDDMGDVSELSNIYKRASEGRL